MSGLISIGTSAVLANQKSLQVAGNNIANVGTTGYSRQTVLLNSVDGQFSGAGYYGKGVDAVTVLRSHNELLTRQIALTESVAASDNKRLDQLRKLEDLFQGGPSGLGAAVGNMLNAFSDVANAPGDLLARTVALSLADETAAHFHATASDLQDLRRSAQYDLNLMLEKVNQLAQRIARANGEISQLMGGNHTPNDLLDKRDQLVRELNGLVQTSSIAASDGSIGIFLAGSQPLVLGKTVSPLSLTGDSYQDPGKSKLSIQRDGVTVVLEEASLGGGALAGLLRFQNTDLVDATNMLGRMALAIGASMNAQHQLGLDLNGAAGGPLFTLGAIPDALPTSANTGTASIQVALQTSPGSAAAALAASDYELTFTGASSGSIRRVSDGQQTAFAAVPVQIDGLVLQVSGVPAAGDRFLVTPFRQVAASMDVALSNPGALAMASPVAASAGATNQGSLALQSLLPQQINANMGQTVVLTFAGPGSFDVVGTGTGNPLGVAYVPGQPINYNGWSLTLKGSPQAGDSFSVQANAYPAINGGNAEALMALRDQPMFDGAPTTDGYANLMSQVGLRVQSAGFAAAVSDSISANAVADQAALAGVNLDEEAARLLQFQQAYQASAKILQVSQTLFDTLIQNVLR